VPIRSLPQKLLMTKVFSDLRKFSQENIRYLLMFLNSAGNKIHSKSMLKMTKTKKSSLNKLDIKCLMNQLIPLISLLRRVRVVKLIKREFKRARINNFALIKEEAIHSTQILATSLNKKSLLLIQAIKITRLFNSNQLILKLRVKSY
jgi:hypothetical protein